MYRKGSRRLDDLSNDLEVDHSQRRVPRLFLERWALNGYDFELTDDDGARKLKCLEGLLTSSARESFRDILSRWRSTSTMMEMTKKDGLRVVVCIVMATLKGRIGG